MVNPNVAERIEGGWSITSFRVDGTDVIAVHEAVKVAVEEARTGGGPRAVEALTLRGHGHAAHDDARYVPEELRSQFQDPIERLRARLLLDGYRTCFLYTDLANPTSNGIYTAIGYLPVCDMLEIRFEGPP